MPSFRYVLIDVFTDRPLEGNALAVFTDAREIPEDLLQPIAREMNLSETVFVYAPTRREPQDETGQEAALDREKNDETVFVYPPEGDGHVRIRVFTPTVELPFAGHPMLGTAFVLAGPLQLGDIRLETGVGIIPVRLERDESGHITFGRMEQPIPTVEAYEQESELFDALGVEGSELPVEVYDNGVRHVFVALASEEHVAAVRPDLGRIAELPGAVGFNVFAGSGSRWKTRMFAPVDGVPEDPATGSAAGPLALHLARQGRIAFGEEIEISQGTEIGRPSTLFARVEGSADGVRKVEVGGSAVAVARGEFRFPVKRL